MKALTINCTLKSSPETSNTEALAGVVGDELKRNGVETDMVRAVDHDILPGVTSDEGEGDGWPAILEQVRGAQILVIATPT
jgi:multimeric flavodoxin WrbA